MNRRSFLRTATGCAVAVPVAATATEVVAFCGDEIRHRYEEYMEKVRDSWSDFNPYTESMNLNKQEDRDRYQREKQAGLQTKFMKQYEERS